MEKEFGKFQEQTESIDQQRKKYEDIKPMDMWPTNESIGKIRLDEIFDTFNDNANETLTQNDKQEIETFISQHTEWRSDKNNILLDIIKFIKEFWNEITKEDLIENIQERFDKRENIAENKAEHSRKENIRNLKSSLDILLPADNKPYKPLLDKLQTINPEKPWTEFDEILAQLNKPETLVSITIDLQKKDQQNGTHNFEAFKSAVINLDPSFKDKFKQAEVNAKLAVWTDTLQNLSSTDKAYIQTGKDSFNTSATLDGRNRKINHSGSDYSLESNIDSTRAMKEAEKLSNDLAESLKPIDKSLSSIKAMKARIEEAKRQGTNLDSLKTELQAIDQELYSRLGLALLNSPDELLHTLTAHESELTAKRAELQTSTDRARERLINEQKEKAKEKDTIRKDSLNFIHEIGLDGIPQATSDTIIANINQAPEKYWLTQKIDFENGSFGFDTDFWNKEISNGEKQKFIELYNKLLTWSKEYPVKLVDWKVVFYESLENAKTGTQAGFSFNIKEFVNRKLWAWPAWIFRTTSM